MRDSFIGWALFFIVGARMLVMLAITNEVI